MREIAERIQKQAELDEQRRKEREKASLMKFENQKSSSSSSSGTKSSKVLKKEPVRVMEKISEYDQFRKTSSRPSSTRNLFRRSRVSPCRKFRQNTSNSGDRPRIGVSRGQRRIRTSRTTRERPMKSDRTILLGTFPPSMTRYQF